jgi:hypothetical protein
MVAIKSQDEFNVISAMLRDAQASHGVVFNTSAFRLTLKKVENRMRLEGVGFLTKTLPRLGKHLDQALSGATQLNSTVCGFKPMNGSKLPRFLGELFSRVFTNDGYLLPDPDATCVSTLRKLLVPWAKYKLPYRDEQEQSVISDFKKAEDDLTNLDRMYALLHRAIDTYCLHNRRAKEADEDFGYNPESESPFSNSVMRVVREARIALNRVFSTFDPLDIQPRHGTGSVATRQSPPEKFRWTNVSDRITEYYPFDSYFCASLGHVSDTFTRFHLVKGADLPARVILVPKDSRGPRLISCEPVENQWIQQGLGKAIVRTVERHPLTRGRVNFTDQEVNRKLALTASKTGDFSTLDLKEASDRVHLELVRLLFPSNLIGYMECCRSLSTELPNGEVLKLRKFAPMGSALCFPVLALTIWALLQGAAPDADTRKSIYVYGDDVIVPSSFTARAIAVLEFFGLKINQNKSCCSGLFRESCGMDAFNGVDVTPVRFRTVWDKLPSPNAYCSWISYANSFYRMKWFNTHTLLCEMITSVFGCVPGADTDQRYPALLGHQPEILPRTKWDRGLQKLLTRVRVVVSPRVEPWQKGWDKLLRYFSEFVDPSPPRPSKSALESHKEEELRSSPCDVSSYTERKTSILVWRWR